MWSRLIDHTEFIKKIYSELPDLLNVWVPNVSIFPSEKKLEMTLVIRQSPDWLPPKWKVQKGNAIKLKLTFWGICDLDANYSSGERCCNIELCNTSGNDIFVQISGAIQMQFSAEAGSVTDVEYVLLK